MKTTSSKSSDYTLAEVLRIQLHANRIYDEALARYMSEPRNIDDIATILTLAYVQMTKLTLRGVTSACPKGTTHKGCRCELDASPELPDPTSVNRRTKSAQLEARRR